MVVIYHRNTPLPKVRKGLDGYKHARTLTPMNTRTQTLPLWEPPKDWATTDLEIPEVTNGASSSTGTSLTT
jgi:hypothetical protein